MYHEQNKKEWFKFKIYAAMLLCTMKRGTGEEVGEEERERGEERVYLLLLHIILLWNFSEVFRLKKEKKKTYFMGIMSLNVKLQQSWHETWIIMHIHSIAIK